AGIPVVQESSQVPAPDAADNGEGVKSETGDGKSDLPALE
ncbi:hypothetical protein LCGC14_0828280, partial [marine sediment metagenome]